MARAENQGLQIALIVFVMLTIVLAVVTFFYVRNYNEAMIQNGTLQKSATDSKKVADGAQKDINEIKEWLGVDVAMTQENVKKTFEDDMKQFAATLPPDKQHYHFALEALWLSNRELNDQYVASQTAVKALEDQNKRNEAERDAQIRNFASAAEKSASDTLSQTAKFNEDREKINDTNSKLNLTVTEKDAERARVLEAASKERQMAQKDIKDLESANQLKAEKLEKLQTSSFEVAHGYVVSVDTSVHPHLAYIDLGSADRLLPLITFSVHDKSANTAQGDGLKARIEVTEILGPHLAAARILDEDLDSPIARQDKIYTPLWQPGQRLHFAILGTIDLSGDGEDDRAYIKNLISASGGVIDAEMDSQGKITGDISTDTRFLLEGKIPLDKLAVDGAAAMIKKAQAAGTERIPADEFLKMSGTRYNQRESIRFGARGTGNLIPAEPDDRSKRPALPNSAANFQKRRPWSKTQPATKAAE